MLIRCLLLAAVLAHVVSAAQHASNAGLKPQRWESVNDSAWGFFQLVRKPKGTVLLIHGCGPGVRAFFPYDPVYCPDCWGLPEYLSQAKQSLARGYSVLALQSGEEGSGCFSSSVRNGYQDDRPRVIAAVERFRQQFGLTKLPLYAMGYSSGGTMLLKTPSYLQDQNSRTRLDGIVTLDAAPRGGFGVEDRKDPSRLKKGLKFPPTLFVAMEAGGAKERGPEQIAFLRKNNVASDMIVSYPRKVIPTFFSDRIPGVTQAQSAQLVAALTSLGALAPDGTVLGWALEAAAAQVPWVSQFWTHVAGTLNLAAGNHENMGEFTAASLAWLEKRGKANVKQLVKQLVPARPAYVTIYSRNAGVLAIAEEADGSAAAPAPGPAAAEDDFLLPVLQAAAPEAPDML